MHLVCIRRFFISAWDAALIHVSTAFLGKDVFHGIFPTCKLWLAKIAVKSRSSGAPEALILAVKECTFIFSAKVLTAVPSNLNYIIAFFFVQKTVISNERARCTSPSLGLERGKVAVFNAWHLPKSPCYSKNGHGFVVFIQIFLCLLEQYCLLLYLV